MGRATRGCGCALAVLTVLLGTAAYLGWRFALPWWKNRPVPSGAELQVHVLDVGPIEGDSILIISPSGKTVLIDTGDRTKGKVVLDALKRYEVQQIDYFIATHPHADHLGAAVEVIKNNKVVSIIDNGLEPSVPEALKLQAKSPPGKKTVSVKPATAQSITRFYDDYREAVNQSAARYEKAQPGMKFDLGGGAFLTILGPSEPFFTREQMKTGGNEPNANSIVARLDYGDFSMLLPADAEDQSEHRMLSKDLNLRARFLKVAHHGSKYATSLDFLNRVKPEVAVISCGEWNRYGHPAQVVLDRLRAANVKVYRTDLQGEVTITTRGKINDYVVKTAKSATDDLWMGRTPQKDDSSKSGFIAYGEFGPPPGSVKRKQ